MSTILEALSDASQKAFRICAARAEALANDIESGKLQMDAPTALRLVATMFRKSAESL